MISYFADWGVGAVILFVLLIVAVIALILWFEIAMFISLIRNKKIDENTKIIWAIGMFLIHPIVAIIYYFTDHQKTKTS
jgi:hypothetical protein